MLNEVLMNKTLESIENEDKIEENYKIKWRKTIKDDNKAFDSNVYMKTNLSKPTTMHCLSLGEQGKND